MITFDDKPVPNPAFETWNAFDQRVIILLNSSLIEEATTEILGLSTTHNI